MNSREMTKIPAPTWKYSELEASQYTSRFAPGRRKLPHELQSEEEIDYRRKIKFAERIFKPFDKILDIFALTFPVAFIIFLDWLMAKQIKELGTYDTYFGMLIFSIALDMLLIGVYIWVRRTVSKVFFKDYYKSYYTGTKY